MVKEPVKIERKHIKLPTGEGCIQELFDIERTLSDDDIQKIKNLTESLHGNFFRDEYHIQIDIPRKIYSSKILTRIISEFIGRDRIEMYVINTYDGNEGRYSRRQALIRIFSVKTNPFLERVCDYIIHLYTS